jgi:hypothetical protein
MSATSVIPVRIDCDAAEPEPCAGTVTLASANKVTIARKKILTLGAARFSVTPGKSKSVKIKVSTRNARSARRLRRFKVVVTATARDAAANQRTVKRTLTLVTARLRR